MVDQNFAFELSGVESAAAWLKAKKNFLIGLALVAALAFGASHFVRSQMKAAELRPWSELVQSKSPWQATPEELAAIRQRIEKSPAEPIAAYWEALQRFNDKDTTGAIASLDAFKSSFANHPLCTTKLVDSEHPDEMRSPVDRQLAAMQRMQQWHTQYPAPTSNPLPKPEFSVSLVTERGTIVLALYGDRAPRSCEVFQKIAPQLKDAFIAKASSNQWIEIGQDHEGAPIPATDVGDDFPPYEPDSVASLFHFSGTVSFRQVPFEKGTSHPDLHVMLKNDFDQDGHSTIFALVVQGLDLLTTISKEPSAQGKPMLLSSPVKITDVKIEHVQAPPSGDSKSASPPGDGK